MSVCRTAYQQLGLTVPMAVSGNAVTSCVVDTGVQMCLAGSYILRGLGIMVFDLVQPKTCVSAAISTAIKILGAVLMVISGPNTRSGEEK